VLQASENTSTLQPVENTMPELVDMVGIGPRLDGALSNLV